MLVERGKGSERGFALKNPSLRSNRHDLAKYDFSLENKKYFLCSKEEGRTRTMANSMLPPPSKKVAGRSYYTTRPPTIVEYRPYEDVYRWPMRAAKQSKFAPLPSYFMPFARQALEVIIAHLRRSTPVVRD